MAIRLESVRGELRKYGDAQVRVELWSVFVCDQKEEALHLVRAVASLGAPDDADAPPS